MSRPRKLYLMVSRLPLNLRLPSWAASASPADQAGAVLSLADFFPGLVHWLGKCLKTSRLPGGLSSAKSGAVPVFGVGDCVLSFSAAFSTSIPLPDGGELTRSTTRARSTRSRQIMGVSALARRGRSSALDLIKLIDRTAVTDRNGPPYLLRDISGDVVRPLLRTKWSGS
jgi:hypothetical protein